MAASCGTRERCVLRVGGCHAEPPPYPLPKCHLPLLQGRMEMIYGEKGLERVFGWERGLSAL